MSKTGGASAQHGLTNSDFVVLQKQRNGVAMDIGAFLKLPTQACRLETALSLLKRARSTILQACAALDEAHVSAHDIRAKALAEVMPALPSRQFSFRCTGCTAGRHTTQKMVSECVARKERRDADRRLKIAAAAKAEVNAPQCKKCWDTKQLTLAGGAKIRCQFCKPKVDHP
jgi:hypothetical protein